MNKNIFKLGGVALIATAIAAAAYSKLKKKEYTEVYDIPSEPVEETKENQ